MDRALSTDARLAGTTGRFPVNGAAIGRDALAVTAGIGARTCKSVVLHIAATTEVRRNFTEYGAMVALARW